MEQKHVGFTGTRQGLDPQQTEQLREKLAELKDQGCVFFHHGDCKGADAEAHEIAARLGYAIVIHPPDVNTARAFCRSLNVQKPKPYLDRNRDIVERCTVLLACPKQVREIQCSGTWATVRYARRLDRQIIVLPPFGRA